jgi:hypothetical protein
VIALALYMALAGAHPAPAQPVLGVAAYRAAVRGKAIDLGARILREEKKRYYTELVIKVGEPNCGKPAKFWYDMARNIDIHHTVVGYSTAEKCQTITYRIYE